MIRHLYWTATRLVPPLDRIGHALQERAHRPTRYDLLEEVLLREEHENILEVGTWNGDTATRLLRLAHRHDVHLETYVGVDVFQDHDPPDRVKTPPPYHEVATKLERFEAIHPPLEVHLHRGRSQEVLPELDIPDDTLVFVDGSHDPEDTLLDWRNVQHLEGATVVFDDHAPTDAWGSRRAVDVASDTPGWTVHHDRRTRYVDTPDGSHPIHMVEVRST